MIAETVSVRLHLWRIALDLPVFDLLKTGKKVPVSVLSRLWNVYQLCIHILTFILRFFFLFFLCTEQSLSKEGKIIRCKPTNTFSNQWTSTVTILIWRCLFGTQCTSGRHRGGYLMTLGSVWWFDAFIITPAVDHTVHLLYMIFTEFFLCFDRPAGLGIAMSIKFRSFNADPTLRFQKFLRGSEKLLSMNIDKPGKIFYVDKLCRDNFPWLGMDRILQSTRHHFWTTQNQ